jgi:hypothetical protein
MSSLLFEVPSEYSMPKTTHPRSSPKVGALTRVGLNGRYVGRRIGSTSGELAAIQVHRASLWETGTGVGPKGSYVGDASGATPFTAVV